MAFQNCLLTAMCLLRIKFHFEWSKWKYFSHPPIKGNLPFHQSISFIMILLVYCILAEASTSFVITSTPLQLGTGDIFSYSSYIQKLPALFGKKFWIGKIQCILLDFRTENMIPANSNVTHSSLWLSTKACKMMLGIRNQNHCV